MVDLRERVEEDRGTLKKIQVHIPGFAGYRRKEDIRAADSLLRLQVADRIGIVRKQLEGCRAILTDSYNTQNLDKLGALIMKFKAVEGDIRHAEQGYTGFSPAVRIEERQLDLLYEYDFSMINFILEMDKNIIPLKDLLCGNDGDAVKNELDKLQTMIAGIQESFKARLKVITGTGVV
jgi:hypothetical protein